MPTHETVVRRMWSLFSEQRWDEAKRLFVPGFVCEWPQSRERFESAEDFVEMNRAYPGNHRIEVRELVEAGDRIVTAVYVEADTGQKAYATSFFELAGGRIARLTEYWSDLYEAPEWRSRWARRY